MKCIFSVDVEDWFHILSLRSTPDLLAWDALPSRVEKNFARLLEIFEERQMRITCFFLGWVARRYPATVKFGADGISAMRWLPMAMRIGSMYR